MNNILRLTTILLLTSASACLAVDGSDELELRSGDDLYEGGNDCDCPDCTQQDSCWALADSDILVSIGADHIDEINDVGGAQLRAQFENDQYIRFALTVVDGPSSIRQSIALKKGVFGPLWASDVEAMESEPMSESEVEALEGALVAPSELVLEVRGVPDYVLPRKSWLTFGTEAVGR